MFSILVSAEACQRVVKVVNGPVELDLLMTPQTEHFHVRLANDGFCLSCLGIGSRERLVEVVRESVSGSTEWQSLVEVDPRL